MFLGFKYLQPQGVWKPRLNVSVNRIHVTYYFFFAVSLVKRYIFFPVSFSIPVVFFFNLAIFELNKEYMGSLPPKNWRFSRIRKPNQRKLCLQNLTATNPLKINRLESINYLLWGLKERPIFSGFFLRIVLVG